MRRGERRAPARELPGVDLARPHPVVVEGALAELTFGTLEAPRAAHRIEFLIGEAIAGRLDTADLRAELDQVRRSLAALA